MPTTATTTASPLPSLNAMIDPREYDVPAAEACELASLPRHLLVRYSNRGLFPAPVRYSRRNWKWRRADILDWLKTKAAEARRPAS